jgi:hypothetical protein
MAPMAIHPAVSISTWRDYRTGTARHLQDLRSSLDK